MSIKQPSGIVAAVAAGLSLFANGEGIESKLYAPIGPCAFLEGYCAETTVPFLAEGPNIFAQTNRHIVPLSIMDSKFAVTSTSTEQEPSMRIFGEIVAHSIVR